MAAIPGRRFPRPWRSGEGLLVLPALLFYLAVYLYPLSRIAAWSLFERGFTLKFYRELLDEPMYFRALGNTLEISFLSTALCLLLGYPLAYLMATTSARARSALMVLVLIPFWTSILVRTFAWMVILGNNGMVNRTLMALGLTGAPVKLLFNMLGVQIGMVHVLLPFMVFPLFAVMSGIDPNILRVARSLGAAPRRAFRHVFLPLSLPGIAAGCVLVFLLAVGFYVTPALLGGPGQITLATMIEMQINTFLNWGFAASLGIVLLLVVGGIFAAFSTLLGIGRLTGEA
ncbi:MAG: ABC transporter permease [Acidisphaera sp.]|nr:ABC transporter permease [Acidisphaera sp.]